MHVYSIQTLMFFFGWLVFKTPKQGAQTTIHLAVSEDVKGVTGTYLMLCVTTIFVS